MNGAAAEGRGAIVKRHRVEVARQWRALKEAIAARTGLSADSVAWVAGIIGLALGLELARRWPRRGARRRSTPSGR